MTTHEFALECRKVQQLDFVDQLHLPDNASIVQVELSPALRAVLPKHLAIMEFSKEEFSVKQVIDRFGREVVEHLINATLTAQAQLRSAKAQAAQG